MASETGRHTPTGHSDGGSSWSGSDGFAFRDRRDRSSDGALDGELSKTKTTSVLNESQPSNSNNANVGALVSKAKKAALSLWMILHSQNCRALGDRCPHPWCPDTKQLLLHVKICAAGPGSESPCPSRIKGCHDTRKLLAHYRRCKGRRSLRQKPQACLVCSLVARHAKNMLMKGGGTAADKHRSLGNKGCAIATVLAESSSSSSSVKSIHVERSFIKGKKDENPISTIPTIPFPVLKRTRSTLLMPPPPPRAPVSPLIIASAPNDLSCTLQGRTSQELAFINNRGDPRFPFSQSLDSNKVGLASRWTSEDETRSSSVELVVPTLRRQRADSCDERMTISMQKNVRTQPHDCTMDGRNEQPTFEEKLTAQNNSFYFSSELQQPSMSRPRSASCGGLVSHRGCETIVEEGLENAHDESVFRIDDIPTNS